MLATPSPISKQLGYLHPKHTASCGSAALNALQRQNYSNQVSWSKSPRLLLIVLCGIQESSPQPMQTSQKIPKKMSKNTQTLWYHVSTQQISREKCGIKRLVKVASSINHLCASHLSRTGNCGRSGLLLQYSNSVKDSLGWREIPSNISCSLNLLEYLNILPTVKKYWCRIV